MSIQPYNAQYQTTLIPQTLLGYSDDGVSAIQINPTSIILGGNLNTVTPITVEVSASTGLTTNRIGGLNVNCNFDMNTNNITNVNTISATAVSDITISADGLIINNAGDTIQLNASSDIILNSANSINLDAQNSSMSLNASSDITIQSNALGTINTNAPNINSFGYSLPICLNQFEQGTWSYTIGGQVFEDVFSSNPIIIALPTQFFADTPQSGYTSTRWQINFDMNCWNFANAGDKGFAIYLSFLDTNNNLYEPFLYNNLTPYCKWDNPPTFNGAYNQFKSINFCDYIDFGGLAGSFDSNVRLQMNIAGDNVFNNVEFKFKLGFTRIQRV